VTDGKKTEGVRFDWLLERIQQELHAAKVMLGIEDGAGISRNFPESSGKGRS
jgi:hypothetical protein